MLYKRLYYDLLNYLFGCVFVILIFKVKTNKIITDIIFQILLLKKIIFINNNYKLEVVGVVNCARFLNRTRNKYIQK